jgi:hypothetical protein
MRLSLNVMRFRAPGFSRGKLPLPTAANLRIAQIGQTAWFDGVRAFPAGSWTDLESFRPRVLVGAASDLQRAAEQANQHAIELSSVDHAVLVLTSCGDQPLTDIVRVVLWQTFGVPVYELFIGPRTELLASECEAHDGWHVVAGADFSFSNGELMLERSGRAHVRTGLTAHLESEPCACGRQSMRLMDVALYSPRRLAAIA